LRNDVIHGKGTGSVGASARFLIAYYESLQGTKGKRHGKQDDRVKGKMVEAVRANVEGTEAGADGPRRIDTWETPEQGWIKVNTDAGFCAQSGDSSAGIVIRDENGKVLLTAWQLLRQCATVEEAEAEACLRGVRLMTEWNGEWTGKPAVIESDCSTMVQALDRASGTRAQWDGLLTDIRGPCMLLPGFKLRMIKREANAVAHCLAKRAMHSKEFVVMRQNYPECVASQVRKEATIRSSGQTDGQSTEGRESSCNHAVT
jgi:hypothetical protein